MEDIIDEKIDTEENEYKEFKRMKREEEAKANVSKIECDCLSPYSDKTHLKETCKNADRLALGAIVVYPAFVKSCASFLGKDPKCSLIAAISYPHGLDVTEIKVQAVKQAVRDGVDEVEVCAPIQLIKEGNLYYFKRECKKLKRAAKNRAVRIVFECSLLNTPELAKACATAADAGVHCVRLNGADSETVSAIKQAVRGKCLIKTDGVETFQSFASACVMGADYVSSKNACDLASLIMRQAEI